MKIVTITSTVGGITTKRTHVRQETADDFMERKLKDAARRLRVIYHEAQNDLMGKQFSWLHAHEKRVEKYKAQVDAGLITQKDFEAWMQGQLFQEQAWRLKRGQLARAMVDIDKRALEIINSGKLDVFAENANWMGFELEKAMGVNAGFGLYDKNAVMRLIRDQPQLLPMPSVNEDKDIAWYSEAISNAVTQGILQGETLNQIAARVAEDTGSKGYNAILRNARTAYTGAQNAGRLEGMRQAREELGVNVKKRWIATLDAKTRDAHGQLDGQEVDVDEPFRSTLGDIMYPGDPNAEPANVYNCRCTLGWVYPKYGPTSLRRVDAETGEDVGSMTYSQWQKMKAGG